MHDSVTVHMNASASDVWALVSDVTRIGEFSPETLNAEWLDGADRAALGTRFRGHVKRNGRGPMYWTTCRISRCVPEREFAFEVLARNRAVNEWSYQIEPAAGGVDVTESYALRPNAATRLYWALAGRWRGRTNRDGMRTTLERIRAVVEHTSGAPTADVGGDTTKLRFYNDLAPWWPLISPVEHYAEEAGEYRRLLRNATHPVHEVLELGSGGGHNAYHLKRDFNLTLVDLSPAMVKMSRALNPDCEHHIGDMRTVRLGRQFDAVFIHDAVQYLLTADDLSQLFATAFIHCKPGAVVLVCPDHTSETFAPGCDCDGSDASDGRGVRYLEWTYDPDPSDDLITTEYSFLLRAADGTVTHAHDSHLGNLLPEATWLHLLEKSGFAARSIVETTTEDRPPRTLFIGERAL